jgi:trehalose 6-phosphate synthase/phosphatase
MKELVRVTEEYNQRPLTKFPKDLMLEKFRSSQKKRIFLLDYDGTLTSLSALPEFGKPSKEILGALSSLSSLPNTFVYIFSGRPRAHLEKWFDEVNVGLAAEHGCFYKHPSFIEEQFAIHITKQGSSSSLESVDSHKNGWNSLVDQSDNSWKAIVRPLFEHYTQRTPGSFVEEKEVNLTWHYRNADPEFGNWQANELRVNLEKIISNMPVSVF